MSIEAKLIRMIGSERTKELQEGLWFNELDRDRKYVILGEYACDMDDMQEFPVRLVGYPNRIHDWCGKDRLLLSNTRADDSPSVIFTMDLDGVMDIITGEPTKIYDPWFNPWCNTIEYVYYDKGKHVKEVNLDGSIKTLSRERNCHLPDSCTYKRFDSGVFIPRYIRALKQPR